VVLIGGDPGIGKSTLLLQALANVSHLKKVLYVSGEESGRRSPCAPSAWPSMRAI
jgi:DNA repair protein RadA/Sms